MIHRNFLIRKACEDFNPAKLMTVVSYNFSALGHDETARQKCRRDGPIDKSVASRLCT